MTNLSELGLEGTVARWHTPQLPMEAEPETSGVLFVTLLCTLAGSMSAGFPCLFYILCVLPDSWAHHFPFLTPKNSILTKLYLKALSFALGPISEAWHPNKQPPSVPGHFAPSSQNAPLIPPSHWKSCHSTFADSARSVIPAAIFRSALPFHACCQNVAYALVIPLLNTIHSFRHRQYFASFSPFPPPHASPDSTH